MHICRYVICWVITMPGTEMNVTPDMLAPIMPNATIYHGDLRSPTKKASLLVEVAVSLPTTSNNAMYVRIMRRKSVSKICFDIVVPQHRNVKAFICVRHRNVRCRTNGLNCQTSGWMCRTNVLRNGWKTSFCYMTNGLRKSCR